MKHKLLFETAYVALAALISTTGVLARPQPSGQPFDATAPKNHNHTTSQHSAWHPEPTTTSLSKVVTINQNVTTSTTRPIVTTPFPIGNGTFSTASANTASPSVTSLHSDVTPPFPVINGTTTSVVSASTAPPSVASLHSDTTPPFPIINGTTTSTASANTAPPSVTSRQSSVTPSTPIVNGTTSVFSANTAPPSVASIHSHATPPFPIINGTTTSTASANTASPSVTSSQSSVTPPFPIVNGTTSTTSANTASPSVTSSQSSVTPPFPIVNGTTSTASANTTPPSVTSRQSTVTSFFPNVNGTTSTSPKGSGITFSGSTDTVPPSVTSPSFHIVNGTTSRKSSGTSLPSRLVTSGHPGISSLRLSSGIKTVSSHLVTSSTGSKIPSISGKPPSSSDVTSLPGEPSATSLQPSLVTSRQILPPGISLGSSRLVTSLSGSKVPLIPGKLPIFSNVTSVPVEPTFTTTIRVPGEPEATSLPTGLVTSGRPEISSLILPSGVKTVLSHPVTSSFGSKTSLTTGKLPNLSKLTSVSGESNVTTTTRVPGESNTITESGAITTIRVPGESNTITESSAITTIRVPGESNTITESSAITTIRIPGESNTITESSAIKTIRVPGKSNTTTTLRVPGESNAFTTESSAITTIRVPGESSAFTTESSAITTIRVPGESNAFTESSAITTIRVPGESGVKTTILAPKTSLVVSSPLVASSIQQASSLQQVSSLQHPSPTSAFFSTASEASQSLKITRVVVSSPVTSVQEVPPTTKPLVEVSGTTVVTTNVVGSSTRVISSIQQTSSVQQTSSIQHASSTSIFFSTASEASQSLKTTGLVVSSPVTSIQEISSSIKTSAKISNTTIAATNVVLPSSVVIPVSETAQITKPTAFIPATVIVSGSSQITVPLINTPSPEVSSTIIVSSIAATSTREVAQSSGLEVTTASSESVRFTQVLTTAKATTPVGNVPFARPSSNKVNVPIFQNATKNVPNDQSSPVVVTSTSVGIFSTIVSPSGPSDVFGVPNSSVGVSSASEVPSSSGQFEVSPSGSITGAGFTASISSTAEGTSLNPTFTPITSPSVELSVVGLPNSVSTNNPSFETPSLASTTPESVNSKSAQQVSNSLNQIGSTTEAAITLSVAPATTGISTSPVSGPGFVPSVELSTGKSPSSISENSQSFQTSNSPLTTSTFVKTESASQAPNSPVKSILTTEAGITLSVTPATAGISINPTSGLSSVPSAVLSTEKSPSSVFGNSSSSQTSNPPLTTPKFASPESISQAPKSRENNSTNPGSFTRESGFASFGTGTASSFPTSNPSLFQGASSSLAASSLYTGLVAAVVIALLL